jgi:pseudomonalisin
MQRNRTLASLFVACLLAAPAVAAAAADLADPAVAEGRPAWAKPANRVGSVPGTVRFGRLGLVVKRSAERQRAYDAYLEALQDPASPDYQRWLDSDEIGARFGADDRDVSAVAEWLAAQGMQVESVSPTRRVVRFAARAAEVERVFGTRLDRYSAGTGKRIAPAAEPVLPAAIADKVERVDGLETLRLHSTLHGAQRRDSDSLPGAPMPKASICDESDICEHFIFPGDFAVLYNLEPAYALGYDGAGQSISIVARARVHADDVVQFRARSALPPMAFSTIIADDGVDPGAAATGCGGTGQPSCDDDSEALLDQMEATLDVTRAAGTAPGAQVKLVTSGTVDNIDGVILSLEHAVYSQPLPARIVSISYSTCEADNSAGAAAYLDELFGDAAMQGISVFVASGDSGARDCTPHHAAPDADRRLSTNLLCSSEHVTCVGGTEINDYGGNYWGIGNGEGYVSARMYIPESAWNQYVDGAGEPQVAASGGGVSRYYPTPAWQVGAGVPEARSGRHVPDVSFNASTHTGYFYCMAAFDGSCVTGAGGGFSFVLGGGTSASAPSMAGIAALLNQRANAAQGNLNPRLYALAGHFGNRVFHDVDRASSGNQVDSCDTDVPSRCNNVTPGFAGAAPVPGYQVGEHYDLVTGLGSLDVHRLLDAWPSLAARGARLNQRGISGSWANPGTDSQGFVMEVTPDHFDAQTGNLFAGWFTYAPDGGDPHWYTLQGKVADNASAVLPIYRTTGGRFDSPQATQTAAVGSATLSLWDCGQGTLDYRFDDGREGMIPLRRLLANVDCSAQDAPPATPADALQGGTWADFGNGGQGLVMEVVPAQAQLFGAWYTFAATAATGSDASGQRWLTLQGSFPPGARELTGIGIFESTGGVFDQPADTATVQVGSADLVFVSCSQATLDYRFTSGPFAGRNGRLDLRRVTAIPAGCD